MPHQAGRNARLRVGGNIFSFKRYRVVDADSGGDVASSEDGGASRDIATLDNVVLIISQATLNTDETPFIAPRNVKTNQIVGPVILYLDGLAGALQWNLPLARVASSTMAGEVAVGGMQGIDFAFSNHGTFKRPGET